MSSSSSSSSSSSTTPPPMPTRRFSSDSGPTWPSIKKTWPSLLAPLICGYLVACFGGVSTMDQFLKRFFPGIQTTHQSRDSYCMLKNQWLAFYGVSIFVTGLVACPFLAAYVTKKHGHRVSIFFGALLVVAGAILEALACNTAMLIAGRLVQGFGFGFLNQAVPPYLAEMAPTGFRGTLVCALQALAKAGALLANILSFCMIRYGDKLGNYGWMITLSAIILLFAVPLACVSMCVLPDTPHRLVVKNDVEGAETQLQHVRRTRDVSFIGSLKLLLEKTYRPIVVTGIFIPMFTQLTGVNLIGPILFRAIGFSPVFAIIIEITSSLSSCISTVVVMFFVDKLGRRAFLISGGVLMFFSLILLGVMEATGMGGSVGHNTLSVLMIIIYAVGFGVSWGPLGVLIPGEIYPSEIRSLGQGMSVTVSFILSASMGELYLPLLCRLRYGIFFVLAAAVFVVTALVCMFLPETRAIPLEQMKQVWSRHWYWQRFIREENDEDRATGASGSFYTISTANTTASSNASPFSDHASYTSPLPQANGHDRR